MTIEELLQDNISKLTKETDSYSRMHIYSSIIELKKILNDKQNKNLDIYTDLKNYISCRIDSTINGEFGYDSINNSFIANNISTMDYSRKLCIFKFIKREYARNGISENLNWCIDNIKNVESEQFLSNRNYLKWIIYKVTAVP